METVAKHEKSYALIQVACIVVLWAAALFETGVDVFRNILGVTSFMLAALALAGLVAIEVLVYKDIKLTFGQASDFKKAILLVLLLCIALNFIGIAWSPLPQAALQKSLRILWYFILSILTILVLQKFSPAFALKVLGISGLTAAAVLLLLVFSASNLGRNWSANSISVFADYNMFYLHLTALILLSLALLNGLFPGRIWLVHGATVAGYALLSFVLLFSGSRRGIIFYCIPIMLLAFFSLIKAKRLIIPLIAIALVAVAAFFTILPILHSSFNFTTVQRILISIRQEGLPGLIGNRVGRVSQAAGYIDEYTPLQLLFGQGTKAYTALYGAGNHPHNFYFNAFLEGGLLKSTLTLVLYLLYFAYGLLSSRGQLLYVRVLILAFSLIYILNISISGEDGLLMKIFWLFFVYFWFASNCGARVKEVRQ